MKNKNALVSDLSSAAADDSPESVANAVLTALGGLRYGTIEVVLHDGRVVQVSRTEKFRPNGGRAAADGRR